MYAEEVFFIVNSDRKSCDSRSFVNFFSDYLAHFSPQIYHQGYLYLIQYFWSNIQIMNIMSFAQMEFVFILPKVSNTQMLRTFYLMYVFQKGGIQRLKIDIYANFIF